MHMARTVGVRFRQAGKLFYYDALDFELEAGDYVVVDSAHGVTAGRVVIAPDQVIANEASTAGEMKPVLRIATPEDIERMHEMQEKAHEALIEAKKKASELGLDMALSSGEFDLDGSQFTAYFSAQERVDFRSLVRELSHDLGTRVQLLQVGDRDRAKLVDGFDICGERLCCSSWMTNFPSVSIRMAKEQDLPLNPQKISGVCGRLYCCLTFEYDDYKALRGTLAQGRLDDLDACRRGQGHRHRLQSRGREALVDRGARAGRGRRHRLPAPARRDDPADGARAQDRRPYAHDHGRLQRSHLHARSPGNDPRARACWWPWASWRPAQPPRRGSSAATTGTSPGSRPRAQRPPVAPPRPQTPQPPQQQAAPPAEAAGEGDAYEAPSTASQAGPWRSRRRRRREPASERIAFRNRICLLPRKPCDRLSLVPLN